MGSSIKGCLVADGTADIYYRLSPIHEWDTCAMHAVAAEAGCIMQQADDTDYIYNQPDTLKTKGFYVINKLESKL